MTAAAGYTDLLQDRIAELFIGVVSETLPAVASVLHKKFQLVRSAALSTVGDELQKLYDSISCDSTTLLQVAEMDAKLIDVQWRARKTAGISVVNAVAQSRQVRTGDTFAELLERFCRKNLPSHVVQSLLFYAHVWPSLTTHPTNPCSLAYTRVGLNLDKILAETAATTTRIVAALRDIRDTSMEVDKGDDSKSTLLEKKTPRLELDETLSILNVIYDSVAGPQLRLREALDRFGYSDVVCDAPLLNLNVWCAGDGDGNPNMDHHLLRAQVLALRASIRKRYVADLQHAAVDLGGESFAAFAAQKELIIGNLLQDRYPAAETLVSDTVALKESLTKLVANMPVEFSKAVSHLNELVIKCRSFGLRFAGTDVRHNSVDIMETIASMLHAVGTISSKDEFLTSPADRQTDVMSSVMDDAKLLDVVRRMTEDEVQQKFGTVGARVFLRMRVIASYPEMFQKLIIAETRSAANAVAALTLLRFAGNVVAAPGAVINVVPLFESRQDLEGAPGTFHTLATDPIFSLHIKHVGQFIAMIAKSDTTRLSGPGVQGRQEETVGRLMAVNPLSYGSGFSMNIFVGGGDDQMRGGGRIVETPHVLMLSANRFGAEKASRFAMTIQGLQMQLVFGSKLLSEHFLEAFAAQQMLAAARLEGHIRYRPVPTICNRKAADQSARDFFADAMDRYEVAIGSPDGTPLQQAARTTIVNYLNCFPASVVTSANKSSRPMARKKTVDPLQGRAISLDQLSKHEGSYITATLGVAEALEGLHNTARCGAPEHVDAALSPLRHTYLANKSFRDFVRMQAVVLFQKDYHVCWSLRGGRPTMPGEMASLAATCRRLLSEGKPASPRELLAMIELQDQREAALLLTAITGREPHQSASVKDPLISGWPDLASKMSAREAQGALSQLIITNAARTLRDEGETPFRRRLAYYGYVGVNPKFSTPSFSLTMTDPQKEGHAKTNESSKAVATLLMVPLWARSQAKL